MGARARQRRECGLVGGNAQPAVEPEHDCGGALADPNDADSQGLGQCQGVDRRARPLAVGPDLLDQLPGVDLLPVKQRLEGMGDGEDGGVVGVVDPTLDLALVKPPLRSPQVPDSQRALGIKEECH